MSRPWRLYATVLAPKPRSDERPRAGHRKTPPSPRAGRLRIGASDGADLSEEERAWCRQSIAWLRGDLDAWSQKLEKRTAQDRIDGRKALSHWRDDPSFAELRDPDALDELLLAERREWGTLWHDIDELIKRSAVPK